MVGVVSGSSLGLFNSGAPTGDAAVGRGRDRAFINSTTGNLVVQSTDEVLSSLGLDNAVVRTYNSQGTVDGDNDDNWRIGFYRNLFGIPSTPGAANSTVSKRFGDGTEVAYTWDGSRYVSTDGDGAHDSLSYSGGTWTWTDGSSRITETYNSSGQLVNTRDADGNVVSYAYNGSLLIRVDDSSGQQTHLIYNGVSQLQEVRVVSNGQTQTLTKYTYDALDRLETVTVDLTPAVTTDSVTYVTRYTYELNSQRLASIVNSDGTAVSFTHTLVNGVYRVRSFSPSEAGLVNSNANLNALTTQVPQTTSADRSLTSSATPAGWGGAPADFAPASVGEAAPAIEYDAAGNGIAAWSGRVEATGEYNLYVRRYDALSGVWSAATVLDTRTEALGLVMDVDAAGNAIVAWIQSDGTGSAVWARKFDATSGTWTPAQVLRAGNATVTSYWALKVVVKGARAAVVWTTNGGNTTPVLLQVARFDGGNWLSNETLDNNLGNEWKFVRDPSIAIDAQGNALVMWMRALATNPADNYQQYKNLYYRYFNAATSTWTTETALVTGSYFDDGSFQPQLTFDDSGNALVTYGTLDTIQDPNAGYNVVARRFAGATQTWGSTTIVATRSYSNAASHSIAVAASGDALVAYTWGGQIGVRTYSAASQSWSAETLIPNPGASSPNATGPKASINGGQMAVSWIDRFLGTSGYEDHIFESRYTGSNWTVPTNLGNGIHDASTTGGHATAVDPFGNITTLWTTSTYQTSNPLGALYTRTYRPTASFVIPSGATWSSVTQTLYGDSSVAAISALQAVIGTPPLTAGNLLRGLPTTLHVETTVMVPVTPYYTVLAGGTWQDIVQAVYGTSDANAVNALRTQLGNPTLTTGLQLQVPLTLQFTASGSKTTLITYTTSGSGQTTANANSAVLSTTDTQTTTNSYNVVSGSLSTTDTQTTTNSYALNSGQLSTTDNQTTSYNRNNGVLSTTDTQNVTNNYTLNAGQLSTTQTQPVTTNYAINTAQLSTTQTQVNNYAVSTGQLTPAGWTSTAFGTSGFPQTETIKFDAAGNGLAISHQATSSTVTIYARRFSPATQTWSAAETVYTGAGNSVAMKMDMDAQGNALVVWTGSNPGDSTPRLFARRFSFSGGWGATSTVYSGAAGFPDTAYGTLSMSVSISGNYAAILWVDSAAMMAAPIGTPVAVPAYVSRFNGSSWTSAVQVGNTAALTSNSHLSVSVDSSGNTMVVTRSQINSAFVNWIHAQRFNASSGTWGSAVQLDSGTLNSSTFTGTTVYEPRLAFDGNGNAFVTWASSGDASNPHNIRVARFDRNSNSWGPVTALATLPASGSTYVSETQVSADASGNAMVVYRVMQSGVSNLYARQYNGASGTWGAEVLVAGGSPQTTKFALANNNGRFALVYGESPGGWGALTTLRVSRFDAGSWQSVGAAGTTTDPLAILSETYRSIAIQPNGNVAVIWTDGTNTFIGSYNGSASYTIPSGATWASIAGTLYGVSSSEAGAALQIAMGNPSIAAGNVLSGWPATLTVTTSVYIGPHYVIQSGDTWQIIANRLYGVNNAEAANALQSAMGNPALVAGNRLMNPPTTLSVTVMTTVTVPPYYTIPGGSSWQSVASTLYGINSTAAGSALQSVYGGQALSAFTRLTGLPSTLSVTTQQTVTVPAYYLVPSGASWQSIANAVYGVNSAAAGAALQSAMGNPSIAAGTHLSALPATLSVTVQVTVPPYYTIPSGASWQSIANTLYVINHANAGAVLQSALGNPALTAGNRLTGLPSSITVTITQTVTVPAYYTIPSGATWQSIANAVYGQNTTAAANALQTALGNPALTAGNRLTGFPNPLAVTTTATVTVPAYYTVPSGATWTTITQAVYGTGDANAVAALRTAVGNPTLSTGLHLTVPASITFTAIVSGPALSTSTDVQDAAGRITTYTQDSAGRLQSVLSPTTGGIRLQTIYGYDASGNLTTITQDPTGLNRVTTMGYDARGNLTSSRDNLGNTLARAYDDFNQLTSETSYVVPDPDGAGSGAPGTPLVKRYIYDGTSTVSESHLRFVIDADGRVTQHQYDTTGQRIWTLEYLSAVYTGTSYLESDLVTWANVAANKALLERTEYAYDFRGNLSQLTTFVSNNASTGAGTGTPTITKFLYDQRGMLLQTIDPRGSANTPNGLTPNISYATTYTYDGLGRVLSTSVWDSASRLVTTLNSYDDANRVTRTTLANGLVALSSYDRSGQLINVTLGTGGASGDPDAFGVTTYAYDVGGRLRIQTDAALVKQFFFYDEAGRKVAHVDGDGSLTEFVYDRASQLIKTVEYSTRLSTANLAALVDASGNAVEVALTTLRSQAGGDVATNRVARSVFDAAGRLVYSIDESGAVTQVVFDGAGRVTDTVQYATRITVPRSVGQLLPSDFTASGSAYLVATSADDRRARSFYDNSGNLVGMLDAGGYILELSYDNAGHVKQETRFANQVTDTVLRATGTLAQLKTAAGTDTETAIDPERDITTNYFYDGQGRKVGVLDGERYLTETVYDVAGNKSQEIRYNKVLTYSGTSTLTSLRTAALASPAATMHTTTYQYDGFGRLTQAVNFEGTQKNLAYDSTGNLLSETTGTGTIEARTSQARYDEMGRVVRELTGEGSAALATLLANNPSAPASQINDVWDRYGVLYVYDQAGRKISATTRPNDAQTNVARYFYDQDRHLRFEVNQLGERIEYRYNALDQVTDKIRYYNRISAASLTGGLLTSTTLSALTASADSTRDARAAYTYDVAGRVNTTTTAESASSTVSYNAFGEADARVEQIDATRSVRREYVYNTRGLLTTTRGDVASGGLNLSEARDYDAFGRITRVTDARGNASRVEYDRLGRETATVTALNGRRITTYDGFSRVLTMRDALSNTTSYVYDDTTRTSTLTTPEGIAFVTVHTRHGQTLSVTAAGNTTTYSYDFDGRLKNTADNLGALESRVYDRGGRLETKTDARGVTTRFSYDAASRTLTKTNDYGTGNLQLLTTYGYDALGRVETVTEPNGRLTRTTYDRDSRVAEVAVDPSGLNQRTSYAYDRQGHTLIVTEGVGSAAPRRTQYVYDALGRRTEEIIDPTSLGGTLNLRTQYRFDANGNVTRKIDAAGNSTWYVYDTLNRLTHTANALGNVWLNSYDAESHVTATRRYATAMSAATMTTLATLDSPAASNISVSTNALDSLNRYFYDRDGREQYTTDAAGTVTERSFDAAGRVTRERIIAAPALTGSYANAAAVTTALGTAATTIGVEDRLQWTAYDVRGRAIFTVDGYGAVARNTYDENDNLILSTAYATRRAITDATDLASLQTWATANESNTQNRSTRFWYDRLDRKRFTLDAEGYLTEKRYADAAREQRDIVYALKPTISSNASLSDVTAAAAAVTSDGQVTITARDLAGRIARVTDAMGNYEEYTYDATGNRQTYRNQKGAIWTYLYDVAGRLTDERSPSVAITTVSSNGTGLSSATESASVVTRYTYDALGNVRTRTEGIRRYSNGTESTTGSRTTTYNYDVVGRQVSTVNPQVNVYTGSFTDTTATTSQASATPTSTVTYDALGNATRNVDIGGGTSYRVYDAVGRLRYEIDALRYVTEHVFDAFGNETTLTRFATALGSIPSYSGNRIALSTMDTAVSALRSNTGNRTISRIYDRANRVRSTVEPSVYAYEAGATAGTGTAFTASPTTYLDYDAFGRVTREWKLVNTNGAAVTDPAVNATANSWATTHHYFDRRGLEIATVDALRYLTRIEYDETGDVTNVREFARALTSFDINSTTAPAGVTTTPVGGAAPDTGYDRETMFMYDVLNRRTSDTLINFEHAWINGLITEVRVQHKPRTFGYDALGNQTSITENGATVYNYYDLLGRLIGRAEPARDPGDGTTLIPLTEIKRDIFGNAAEEIRYGNGAATVSATTYTLAATSTTAERHSFVQYDALDRAIASQDARGALRNAAYNARGDLVKEWQTVSNRATTDLGATPTTSVAESLVTMYQYDVLGQRTATHEVQRAGGSPITVRSRATYNGFGEIATKTVDGGWTTEFFDYDNAGRVWRTNTGDGVDKVYLYNLGGEVTAELRSRTLNLADSATYTNAASVNALSGTMRTETRYDLLNRIIEQRAPQFEIQSTQDLIDSQPQMAVVATPSPPNAIYRQVAVNGGSASYPGGWGGFVYVAQVVSFAEGGGWYQVQAPSTANPYGVYARYTEAQYSVSQQRQFSWQKYGYDVIATFEYWPTSNPSAVSTLDIYTVAPDRVGVNVNALSGSFGYRISYKRVGATSNFATQQGTFTTSTNEVVRGTTVAVSSQTVTPTTLQAFDRWGKVISVRDAAGNLTQYRYNQLGQLTYTLLPSTTILDTSFSIEQRVGRAQLSNYYDIDGRMFENRDAVGNTTRVFYNKAGQLIRQQNADHAAQLGGSEKRFVYDAFNNQIQVRDELGYRTRNVYDKADNLIQVAREIELVNGFASASASDTSAVNSANVLWEYYGYDETGRRISDTNGEGEVTKYWYDLRGNMIRRRTPRNFDTTFEYDAFSRKTRETDANASFSTWSYDAFGRLTAHAEMVNSSSISGYFTAGGAVHAYTYDEAGLMTLETSSLGKNRALAYDAAGHLTSITDNGTALGGGLVSLNRVTTYNYDAAGRKAREREVIDGRTHQDTRIEYDGMGRIASLDDLDYRLQYFYDANGNRTLIKARYFDHTMVARLDEGYYRYDQMNRVTISQGKRSTGAVPDVVFDATQGVKLTYDAKGQRTSARTRGTRLEVIRYQTNGVVTNTTYNEFSPTDQLGTDFYAYDGLGRLKTLSRETFGIIRDAATNQNIGGFDTPTAMSDYEYDKASRQVTAIDRKNVGPNLNSHYTYTVYDDDGRSTTQSNYNGGALESIARFGDAGSTTATRYNGYDAANVLRGYKLEVYDSGTLKYTSSYQMAYRLGEGYQDTGQSVTSTGTSPPGPASTSRIYDVNNDLVQFNDSGDVTATRYFANNSNGQVLTSIKGQFDGASGRMTVAQAWNAAVSRTTTNQPKAQYFFFVNGNNTGSFGQLQKPDGTFDANFDVNYTPVSSNYPASAPSQVLAQTGDTLRTLAGRVFGDASLWYVLAEENGLSDPSAIIKEGTVVKVPNEVVSLSNTAGSFKPFDASEALGDTSATQAPPPAPKPKKGGCGVIGMIIVIIVAIVVTVFTAGAAAAALAPALGSFGSAVVGGAIGAAVGSIASQGVGIAIGVQDKFNWSSVAKAAIGGAIGGALFGVSGFDGASVNGYSGILKGGQWLSGATKVFGKATPFVQGAFNATVSNVLTQGVSMAFGLQDKFSWRDVAASAAGGGVGAVVGGALNGKFGASVPATIATKTLTGFASGVSQAVVRGGKVDYASIAADAFGNALGNAILDAAARTLPSVLKNATQAEKDAFFKAQKIYGRKAALDAVTDAGVQDMLKKQQLMDDYLSAHGVKSIEDLPPAQQAELLDSVYKRAIVSVEQIDLPPPPPEERPSLATRVGRGLSRAVVGGTEVIADLTNRLGEDNVGAGMFVLSLALGGIPKTVINYTVGEKVEELKQAALKPITNEVSEFIAAHGFDARTTEEMGAVKPASDVVANVTVGFVATLIIGGGYAGIAYGTKKFRAQREQAAAQKAALREKEIELKQDLDSEAGHMRSETRPSWRQSERDLHESKGPDGYEEQRSFKDGEDAKYGSRGSTRPDEFNPDSNHSIDIKNYDVMTQRGQDRLVDNIVGQAEHRQLNLPPGSTQSIVIDARGQYISNSTIQELKEAISSRSGGIIPADSIDVWKD